MAPAKTRSKRCASGGGGNTSNKRSNISKCKISTTVAPPSPNNKRKKKSKPAPPTTNWALNICAPSTTLVLTSAALITENDVLFGRGSRVAKVQGNCTFRVICWEFRKEYHDALKSEKLAVALKVMERLAQLDPPCRFVEKLEAQVEPEETTTTTTTGNTTTITTTTSSTTVEMYQTVSPARSLEKVCQTLREQKIKPPIEYLVSDKAKQVAAATATAAAAAKAIMVSVGRKTRNSSMSLTAATSSTTMAAAATKVTPTTTTTTAATTSATTAKKKAAATVVTNKKDRDKVPVKKKSSSPRVLIKFVPKEKKYPAKAPRKKLAPLPPPLQPQEEEEEDDKKVAAVGDDDASVADAAATATSPPMEEEEEEKKPEAKTKQANVENDRTCMINKTDDAQAVTAPGGKVQELLEAATVAAAPEENQASHNDSSSNNNTEDHAVSCPLTLLDKKFAVVPPQLTVFESGMYSADHLHNFDNNNKNDIMEAAAAPAKKGVITMENQAASASSSFKNNSSVDVELTAIDQANKQDFSSHHRSKSIATMRLLLQRKDEEESVNKIQEENNMGPPTTTPVDMMDIDIARSKPPDFYHANSLFLDDDDFNGGFPIKDHHGREPSQTHHAPSPNAAMDVMDFVEPPPSLPAAFLPKRVLFPQDLQHAHEMTNASRLLLLHPTSVGTTTTTAGDAGATAAATNNMTRDLMDVFPLQTTTPRDRNNSCSLSDVDLELLEYIQPPELFCHEFQPTSRRALDFDDAPVHHHHHHHYESSANENSTTTTCILHPGAPTIMATAGSVAAKMFAAAQLPTGLLDTQPDFGLHMNHHHHPFQLPHDAGVGDHHVLDDLFDDDDYRPVNMMTH